MIKNIFRRYINNYNKYFLIVMLVANVITYYGTRVVTANFIRIDMRLSIDSYIPFVPIFVVPYYISFIYWTISYILLTNVSRNHCFKYCVSEIIAKLFTGLIFVILPTTMIRGNVNGNDVFSRMVLFLYETDAPNNLFPSIHCLESWIILRGTLSTEYFSKKYKVFSIVMTLLIFMSVVLVKQHVFVDIIGALVVSELSLHVVKKYILDE